MKSGVAATAVQDDRRFSWIGEMRDSVLECGGSLTLCKQTMGRILTLFLFGVPPLGGSGEILQFAA